MKVTPPKLPVNVITFVETDAVTELNAASAVINAPSAAATALLSSPL